MKYNNDCVQLNLAYKKFIKLETKILMDLLFEELSLFAVPYVDKEEANFSVFIGG